MEFSQSQCNATKAFLLLYRKNIINAVIFNLLIHLNSQFGSIDIEDKAILRVQPYIPQSSRGLRQAAVSTMKMWDHLEMIRE
jgi:hypothetical protein